MHSKNLLVTVSSGKSYHVTRSFTSFSHAANENADSRVMAGIHFRFSCDAGQELENNIGNWGVDNHLRPVNHK